MRIMIDKIKDFYKQNIIIKDLNDELYCGKFSGYTLSNDTDDGLEEIEITIKNGSIIVFKENEIKSIEKL